MISVKDVWKKFGEDIQPLKGINIDVQDGTTTVLVGKSGSGKSVLLKSIVGLLVPERGSITVDDTQVIDANPEVLQEIRHKVGYVFQNGALYDSLTVGENLAFPLEKVRRMSGSELEDRVRDYLNRVGLLDKIDKMPSELSGGQRKRVGVARTIITEPEYLLYDEPTTGLDPQTTKEISDLIVELQHDLKITSIAVTHDPYCTNIIADRVAYIENGQIVFDGTVPEAASCDVEFLKIFFTIGSNHA